MAGCQLRMTILVRFNREQVLTEVKSLGKTLVRAAPTAVVIVSILYMLANVAYFAAVPRDQLLTSGVTIAGRFFLNVKTS